MKKKVWGWDEPGFISRTKWPDYLEFTTRIVANLFQHCCANVCSYDHLTRLLIKVIDERPNDVVDVIEDMSYDVKWASFEYKQSTLQDLQKTTSAEVLAEQQRLLFYRPEEADQEEELVPALNE